MEIVIALIKIFPWIAALIGLWWFRKPLTGVLDRIRTFKGAVGGASGTVEAHIPEPITASTPAPAAPPSPEALEDASRKAEALEDKSKDADGKDWLGELFQALEAGDADKARGVFDSLGAPHACYRPKADIR